MTLITTVLKTQILHIASVYRRYTVTILANIAVCGWVGPIVLINFRRTSPYIVTNEWGKRDQRYTKHASWNQFQRIGKLFDLIYLLICKFQIKNYLREVINLLSIISNDQLYFFWNRTDHYFGCAVSYNCNFGMLNNMPWSAMVLRLARVNHALSFNCAALK